MPASQANTIELIWPAAPAVPAPPVSTEATDELLPFSASIWAVAPTSWSSASSVLSIFSRNAATTNDAAAPPMMDSVTPARLVRSVGAAR